MKKNRMKEKLRRGEAVFGVSVMIHRRRLWR